MNILYLKQQIITYGIIQLTTSLIYKGNKQNR